LGLLETEEVGAVRMHQLMATFVRGVAADDEAQTAAEVALAETVDPLIDKGYPAALQVLLPHLRALIDAGKEREDEQIKHLSHQLGRCLYVVGSYPEAQSFFERVLAITKKMHGEEHPATAYSLYNLAIVLSAQGEYDEARHFLERALAISENVYGEEHPNTERVWRNLTILDTKQKESRSGF
jgi:tetratricopeptide (TPR) repeat protein